ncbi:MAG: hypothetical protein ACRBDI_00310 [Alphaproteobacteria bacterium]
MSIDLNVNVKDALWDFHWDIAGAPFVKFTNPKSRCVVKYDLKQLDDIVTDEHTDHSFIPVPKYVLESALEVYTRSALRVA